MLNLLLDFIIIYPQGGVFMDLLDEFWKILLAHFEKTNSDFTIKHWIMPAKLLKFVKNRFPVENFSKKCYTYS